MTKLGLRTQPPTISNRQLKDQLWSLFRHEDRRTKAQPHAVLSDVWLHSRPYAASLPGLCRMDTLILNMAPIPNTDRPDARTPVQAYGFDAKASYFFLRPPRGMSDDLADRRFRLTPWRDRCPDLDADRTAWFDAADDDVANDGYRTFMEAVDEIRSTALDVEPCDRSKYETRSCRQILLDLDLSRLESIQTCESESGTECFRLFFDSSTGVQIVRAASGDGALAIRSIALTFYITTGDLRLD